jgi:uncharacterized membrane protein YbaN (DUF454 family)
MRALYLSLAAVTFALGVTGFFLPFLPGTPFLLLTSWFLVRASPALNEKLHRTRLFGPLLRDWERHHGVRLQVKVSALGVVALAVALSLAFAGLSTAGQVALVACAAVGATVILCLRTVPADEP